MTTSNRVAATIAITAALIAGSLGFGVQRAMHWHRIGWLGVAAQPATQKPPPKVTHSKTLTRLLTPGRIGVAMPRSPAQIAGVHAEDVIVAINGIPFRNTAALQQLDAKSHTGDLIVYDVLRDNKPLTFRMRIASPYANWLYALMFALSLVVGAVYVAIGLMIFLRKPDDRRAIVFNAMSVVAAVTILTGAALTFDGSGTRGILFEPTYFIPMAIYAILAVAGLPLTLHLALVFPKERPIVGERPHVIRWIYALMYFGVLFIATVAAIMQMVTKNPEAHLRQLGPVAFAVAMSGLVVALRVAYRGRVEGTARAFATRPIQTLYAIIAALETLFLVLRAAHFMIAALLTVAFAILAMLLILISYPILTCIVLFRSYRDAGVEEKRQVKWPLWGTFVALAIKILCFAASVLFTTVGTLEAGVIERWMPVMELVGQLPRVTSLLIPISFAFAILKHRLMNIDVIIRKTVSYAFLSGAIIVIYIVLVGGAGTLLVSFAGVKSTAMVIASTVVVALVFFPLRDRLQTLVDRNLFRHRYQYPDALRAISTDAMNASDTGSLLFMAAEKLQQALQNRSVVFFVRRHDEYVAAEKIGVPDSIVGSLRVPANAIPDIASPALKRIGSVLVIPMRTQSNRHGFISFGGKLTDRDFEDEDIAFVRAVADQIAVAIERIRLQREEGEFEQARTMQQTLLPRATPRVAGLDVSGIWQPARAVGGDYYDVLELAPTQLAVCIGDVAGKGMSAALLMSGLQAAVRASAFENVAPRDLCERVRRVVVSSLTGGRFVTFFFCTLDTATRRIRWCNAGHNAPLLVGADGTVERMTTGGPVFSRVFREPYEEGEVALQTGDRLVLFTDGASEARARGGEMFEEERLEELIVANRDQDAATLQRTIVDAVFAFSGAELEDDLTLVVVAVNA
ncbi:MAG TPA: SpoIIE family protein phosphatase [Thermoanaerobaculia bacterium]|nr:SpoIIE family protein phosphatase [Thermoanaerobaculia bacterium]